LNPGGQEEGALDPVVPVSSDSSDPRRALALMPIALRSDAVPVEYRDTHVAVAGRRVERGRVVIIGYRDTWRWRMGGGAGAVQQHRAWWSDLVASVAYAGRVRRNLTGIDEAPYAHLVERLGAPLAPAARGPARVEPPVSLLFTLFAAGLLLNWTSRRLRGSA
jgi:hypothetical protein